MHLVRGAHQVPSQDSPQAGHLQRIQGQELGPCRALSRPVLLRGWRASRTGGHYARGEGTQGCCEEQPSDAGQLRPNSQHSWHLLKLNDAVLAAYEILNQCQRPPTERLGMKPQKHLLEHTSCRQGFLSPTDRLAQAHDQRRPIGSRRWPERLLINNSQAKQLPRSGLV